MFNQYNSGNVGSMIYFRENSIDLHHVLTWSRCILFADDTTIYFSHNNVDFLKWCLSEDLKALSDWFRANKLTLNLQKTVCVHFTDKQVDAGRGILLGNVEISFAYTTKFLGVWLDKNMSWKGHVSKLMIKLKKNLSLLREAKKFLNIPTLRILYFAQIFSHLSYCLGVWGNLASSETIKKLQSIQNKCVRIILNEKHINNNDYINLKFLKIKELIKLENLKFAYKFNKISAS